MSESFEHLDKKVVATWAAGVFFSLNSLILSAMMPSLGHEGFWFIAANLSIAIGILGLGYLGEWAKAVFGGGLVVAIVCVFLGYRTFSGMNYHLKYQVCGALGTTPTGAGGLRFETDFTNDTDDPIWLHMESRHLEFAGRASTLPTVERDIEISPHKPTDLQIPVVVDGVLNIPRDIPQNRSMRGQVRYTYSYGKDRRKLDKVLVVNGGLSIDFDENGHPTPLHFDPKLDSTDYDPRPCDPSESEASQPHR